MDKDTSVRTSSGRKKMRINFIDIILILIIVAAVAVLGYIILSPQINISSKAEAVTIQYHCTPSRRVEGQRRNRR